MENLDFSIKDLGPRKIKSPAPYSNILGDSIANFVRDDDFIFYNHYYNAEDREKTTDPSNLMQKAGPREYIYFNPGHTHAAIVTCGGLCPGLNDVIRAIVRALWYRYGVQRISGIRYGYRGFLPEYNMPIKELNPVVVDDIHNLGGTILGSSRGGCDVEKIVDAMERMNLNILFTIGGDGTQRGARDIAAEIAKRGLKIAIVGIPKTIDNDLSFIHKSFGFETAVSKAVEAVHAAHTEAKCAVNGIGVVKVMGRESGFIAAHTALATNDANFVLIPEVPFEMDGENGLLTNLKKRIDTRFHAVVLIAEGAGQDLLKATGKKDAGGNKILPDIGQLIKDRIREYFKLIGQEIGLKYIDPSYMIRASAATPEDSLYCARLGAQAAHCAMAGKTEVLISEWNNEFVHVPIKLAVSKRNFVDPESPLWRDVLESTRQPIQMVNK
jgi:6-phosphofructokinase 1